MKPIPRKLLKKCFLINKDGKILEPVYVGPSQVWWCPPYGLPLKKNPIYSVYCGCTNQVVILEYNGQWKEVSPKDVVNMHGLLYWILSGYKQVLYELNKFKTKEVMAMARLKGSKDKKKRVRRTKALIEAAKNSESKPTEGVKI